MLKDRNYSGLPGSTVGGQQDKYVAELVDGRYVPVRPPEPLVIGSWAVVVTDEAKFSAAMHFDQEPGPPSIVDVLTARIQADGRHD